VLGYYKITRTHLMRILRLLMDYGKLREVILVMVDMFNMSGIID